jgi:hypothetical protein
MLSKSKPNRMFGGKSSVGTVTVLETKVHRSSARKAKFGFYLTAFIVGLLAATIAADRMHPILALLLGAAIGVPTGAVVWTLVRVWPVIRLIWWWLPEILLAVTVVYGWTALARNTGPVVRVLVVAILIGVPAAIPAIRRRIIAVAWCFIVRHRLRTCFAQFITANASGSLPLIGLARPTPVGERVTIYLRPGLSLADLQNRLDKLAVGCHAGSVLVERASTTNAARVRIDIKRRDVLTAHVGSPLVGLVDPNTPTNTTPRAAASTALDLPDVTTAATPRPRMPVNPRRTPATPATPAPPVNGSAGDTDDVTQWI